VSFIMMLVTVTPLVHAWSSFADTEHGRRLSYTSILSYSPGSQVTDHSRIDLDQKAIQNFLSTPDYVNAKTVHDSGIYSKPSAVCTIDSGSLASLPSSVAKKDKVYFKTVGGSWVEGKAYAAYDTSTFTTSSELVFTYPVPDAAISYPYPYGTGPTEFGSCWVGELPFTDQETSGCIDGSASATPGSGEATTSTFVIGTGTSGASGCTSGTSGSFGSCATVTAQITATCTNRGKRSLKGFSTAAKKKMYDPTLSSSDCPAKQTSPYVAGCPYTSYEPYWNYYCSSSSSPCNSDGGYANTIIAAALLGDNSASGLTNGGMDFTSVADSGRKEMIKKGTAYMSAWMYAIREFEDAIDDCTNNDLTANAGSSGPVHAWDEGVAFYVGSVMNSDDLAGSATGSTITSLDKKGYLAYTLANKRCKNFKTCGYDGNANVGEAKANIDLWNLFTEGQRKLLVGACADVVSVKDDIVKKMTIPLIQGTLRYAFKQATTTASDPPKEKGEGAIFAAAVLPQVHACSASAATTIYSNMNINNNGNVDYNAVKAAFEGCYSSMGVTCVDIGGLWDGTKYMLADGSTATPANPGVTFNAAPCQDASTATSSSGLSMGAKVGIIAASAAAGVLLLCLGYMVMQEKAGKPIFYSVQVKPGA